MSVPASYEDLQQVLTARIAGLAAGQRRLAELFLTDPEGCAFRTASEIAQLSDVHESSVVRFAKQLGLDGYPALAKLCRDHLRNQAQLVQRFETAVQLGAERESLLGSVVSQDQANLSRTFSQLDTQNWEQAVDWLAEAPKVHVIGMRKCFSVAYLLAYLLKLVRREVHQLGAAPGGLVEELRDLVSGEVLVAVSIYRYSRDTVAAVEAAARAGVRVVALTDTPASPLAEHADVSMYVATGGVTVLRSVTAFVGLAQALATATAVRLGASSRSALLLEEDLLESLSTYQDRGAP